MLFYRQKVKTKLPIIEVEADMMIFEKGESDETIYLLIEGSVKIYVDRPETTENKGGEQVMATIENFQIFGDNEIYSHKPRSFSAKTTEKSKLVMIKTQSELELLVNENRWLSGGLMENMSEQLVQTNATLTSKKVAEAKVNEPKNELNLDVGGNKDDETRTIVRK